MQDEKNPLAQDNALKLTLIERAEQYIAKLEAPTRARDIAVALGLTYRQTLDAIVTLHRRGKIFREGKKAGARWRRIRPGGADGCALGQFWKGAAA